MFIKCGYCHEHTKLECTPAALSSAEWEGLRSFLVHISAIWNNRNWSEPAWSRKRALNSGAGLISVCVTVLISKLPFKKIWSEYSLWQQSKFITIFQNSLPKAETGKSVTSITRKWRTPWPRKEVLWSAYHSKRVFLKQTNKKHHKETPPTPLKKFMELIRNVV